MFKLFLRILKDERGIDPILGAGLIMGGSTLLGGLLGKQKTTVQEPYSGYYGMMGDVSEQIRQRIGQPGAAYTGGFDIPQPEVERATEETILGRLGDLPEARSYEEKLEASKTQQITREKERAAEQMAEEAEMYNRLGLVSSTPWLGRAGELGEESLGRQRDIETGMDIYGLEYGMSADKLAADIANMWTTQGSVLGGAQRGYEQYPIQMAYEDWKRQQDEPYKWASLGMGGQMQPSYTQEPNIWSQVGQTGQDIGSLLMMQQLLAGGGKTATPKLAGG